MDLVLKIKCAIIHVCEIEYFYAERKYFSGDIAMADSSLT